MTTFLKHVSPATGLAVLSFTLTAALPYPGTTASASAARNQSRPRDPLLDPSANLLDRGAEAPDEMSRVAQGVSSPPDPVFGRSSPLLPALKGCPKGGRQDYRGAKLEGSDFRSKKDMRDSNFCGATIIHAHFNDVDLTGSTFYGARIEGVDFTNANLSGTDFYGATVTHKRKDIIKTVTRESVLHRVKASGVNFYGARVEGYFDGADLRNANMYGANFTGSRLRANLAGSTMIGGDFRGVDFADADLCRVKAKGANFTGAKGNANTKCWCKTHPC
jgi:uncharacterized protein YjbI with pentapeptide repeats